MAAEPIKKKEDKDYLSPKEEKIIKKSWREYHRKENKKSFYFSFIVLGIFLFLLYCAVGSYENGDVSNINFGFVAIAILIVMFLVVYSIVSVYSKEETVDK